MIRRTIACISFALLLLTHITTADLQWNILSLDDAAPSAHSPSPREGQSAVAVDDKVYVFGGCDLIGKCYGDLYIFDSKTRSWSKPAVTGDCKKVYKLINMKFPPPRAMNKPFQLLHLERDIPQCWCETTFYCLEEQMSQLIHNINTYLGNYVYLNLPHPFVSDGSFNDVYKFELTKNRWTLGESVNVVIPESRGGHSAATDGTGKIYIFGGYNQDGTYLNDLWIIDTNVDEGYIDEDSFPIVFSKPVTSGATPSSRESTSLTVVGDRLYLFGGYGPEGLKDHDLWVYEISEQKWFHPDSVGQTGPPRREGHAAVRNGDNVIIIGGCDVTRNVLHCYNDVWSLDTKGLRWTLLSNADPKFVPRESHTATFVTGGRIIIFGGAKLTTHVFKDVLEISGLEACPGSPESCSGHGSCFEGLYCKCADGWTSHDCGQRLTCPFNCHEKGSCVEGKCVCNSGYIGPSCFSSIPCPSECSNNGACSTNRTCECYPGYYGDSCQYGSSTLANKTAPPKLVTQAAPQPRTAPPSLPPSWKGAGPLPSIQRTPPLSPHVDTSGMNSYQQNLVGPIATANSQVQPSNATFDHVEQHEQGLQAGASAVKSQELPLYIKIITFLVSTTTGSAVVIGMLYVNLKKKEAAVRGY